MLPLETNRQSIDLDGVTLAYEECGQGEPVVFIHGFPASSYSWRQVARAISDHNRTVCFDLMGFGYSDKPCGENYSIGRQAELIIGAIAKLGLESVTLVGHSIGGGVCLEMLHKLGGGQSLVSGLVLVNSVCYPQRLPWFMMALCVPCLPRLVMKLIPERWGFAALECWMYHPRNGMQPEAAREYAERLQSPGAHEAMIAVAKDVVPRDIDALVASYPDIRVPTLILWGKQDRVLPLRFAKRLAGDISGSVLCEIDMCGHCPQEERPDETTVHVQRFVEAMRRRNG